ncbi:hypothetical protein, partial [Streptococcus gallolyticus]|uniref:hypothetical protein n=1 Tax=Streptococcus gallolyticus TaxID=315405 RepID=UPI0018C86E72
MSKKFIRWASLLIVTLLTLSAVAPAITVQSDDDNLDVTPEIATQASIDLDTSIIYLTGEVANIEMGKTVYFIITDENGNQVTATTLVAEDDTFTVVGGVDVSSLTSGDLTIFTYATNATGATATDTDSIELLRYQTVTVTKVWDDSDD